MDPKREKPKVMPEMQEETRPSEESPLSEHKINHTGYGVAYHRADVKFVPLNLIYLNLTNPRYFALGSQFGDQSDAFGTVTELSDINTLRKSIVAIGLQTPLEVTVHRDGYRVIDGNRRRAALQLASTETGKFTEVPVHIFQLQTDDEIANYLLVKHGVSQAKSWSPIAKWQVPYRDYKVLKYDFAEISRRTGIPASTVGKYVKAMELWEEYGAWLVKNGLSDDQLYRRLSSLKYMNGLPGDWFAKNKEICFSLLRQGRLDIINRLRYLPEILENPHFKSVLDTQGLIAASAQLLMLKGPQQRKKK